MVRPAKSKPKEVKPQAKPPLDKEALQKKIREAFRAAFSYEDEPRFRRLNSKKTD